MAHLSLQVLPRGANGSLQLQQAIMQHRLEKYPGDFVAQFDLGVFMLQQKRNADAVRYLRGAVAVQPNHPAALAALGQALLAEGDANDAVGFLERALQANPHYAYARSTLAGVLVLEQRWEEAAGEFRKLLADRPGDAEAQQQLGNVLRVLGYQSATRGSMEQAVAYWREALRYRPEDAALHNDLGAVLARLGRVQEAIPEFETALKIDPNFEPARRNLAAARGQRTKP
jgi:tetratricopeptide (TPR) repeat protein